LQYNFAEKPPEENAMPRHNGPASGQPANELAPVSPIHVENSYTGTSGNNALTGTAGADTFDISQGGNDTVKGLGGDDYIYAGGALTAADKINGGSGSDTLELNGNYAKNLTLQASTITNVEKLILDAGHNYNLTMNDGNAAAGATVAVDASALGVHNFLTFDGTSETNGTYAVIGGHGNDVISGALQVDISEGGNDVVNCLAGTIVTAGAALTSDDQIIGQGKATIELNGDYDLVFNASTATNVSRILLGAANYDLTLNDATASASGLIINGASLGLSNTLTVDGSAEKHAPLTLIGGEGDDILTGGGGDDTFTLRTHGTDIANGGAGNDLFEGLRTDIAHLSGGAGDDVFDVALSSRFLQDTLDGGSGNDVLILTDTVSAPSEIDLKGSTIHSVETIQLMAAPGVEDGYFQLILKNENVSAGHVLTIDATTVNDLGAAAELRFDGSAETNGSFVIELGAGGGAVVAGQGDDTITASGDFYSIDGQGGNDTFTLDGDYSGQVYDYALKNIDTIKLTIGHTYDMTFADGNVAAGAAMTINGSALTPASPVILDASAETDGSYHMIGGAEADHFIGGAMNDVLTGRDGVDFLTGGLGQDILTGGNGGDRFFYSSVAESTGAGYDTIVYLGQGTDKFHLPVAVTGIDGAVTHGALSNGSFDSDLSAALTSSKLDAGHAVLFTPDSGGHAGQTFLVVDANGTAGYQAEQDFVFLLRTPTDLSNLDHMFTT
jgi:Ca2+-binding RTX toxin-like protein